MPEETLVEQEYDPHGQRLRLIKIVSFRKEDLRRGAADVHTSGAGDIYTRAGGKGPSFAKASQGKQVEGGKSKGLSGLGGAGSMTPPAMKVGSLGVERGGLHRGRPT